MSTRRVRFPIPFPLSPFPFSLFLYFSSTELTLSLLSLSSLAPGLVSPLGESNEKDHRALERGRGSRRQVRTGGTRVGSARDQTSLDQTLCVLHESDLVPRKSFDSKDQRKSRLSTSPAENPNDGDDVKPTPSDLLPSFFFCPQTIIFSPSTQPHTTSQNHVCSSPFPLPFLLSFPSRPNLLLPRPPSSLPLPLLHLSIRLPLLVKERRSRSLHLSSFRKPLRQGEGSGVARCFEDRSGESSETKEREGREEGGEIEGGRSVVSSTNDWLMSSFFFLSWVLLE